MTLSSKFKQLMNDTKHLENLSTEIDKVKSKTDYGDDNRYWKPEVDKAGNGYAVIRFLPVSEKDFGKLTRPFVKLYSHGFKGPTGKWYIENSRTTLGEEDPVSQYNSVLWNSGDEEKIAIARKQKRKLAYISNILVVKDEKHPENEGKVFLFKYGPKILEKLEEATKPTFPDQPKFNPFHHLEGANFKLKIRNGDGGFRNYSSSEFDKQSPIADGNEEKIQAIWESEHSLLEIIDPANFKPYKDLHKKLESVLGTAVGTTSTGEAKSFDDDDEAPWSDVPATVPVATTPRPTPPTVVAVDSGDDDEDLAMFKKLAG
jgi:hypothetical protein